jgi:hypothetical protein
MEYIQSHGDVLVGFVPEVLQAKQRQVAEKQDDAKECQEERVALYADFAIGLTGLAHADLLDEADSGLRLELDLAEGRLVLRDILLENVEERLGLLRTDVDTLKIMNLNVVGGRLINFAERQKEIPQVDPHLNAIGVIFAIVRGLHQLDPGSCGLSHRLQSSTR